MLTSTSDLERADLLARTVGWALSDPPRLHLVPDDVIRVAQVGVRYDPDAVASYIEAAALKLRTSSQRLINVTRSSDSTVPVQQPTPQVPVDPAVVRVRNQFWSLQCVSRIWLVSSSGDGRVLAYHHDRRLCLHTWAKLWSR